MAMVRRSLTWGIFILLLSAVCCLFSIVSAFSQESPCLICHSKFKKPAKVVHAALGMGCETCHQAVQGKNHPEKGSMKLMQDVPGLCFGCHEERKFKGTVIHSPVAGGMCTSCHNPHQSEFSKLLISDSPDLCYNCHDKAEFTRKNVHAAVFGGCNTCHAPHVSGNKTLLLQSSINGLCLQCHPNVPKGPHATAKYGGGHPLKRPTDPARKDKEFTCSSCHNPHSSDSIRLFRYKASSGIGLCRYCHKM